MFQVPYPPIDPKDVGRDYEAVIRINSQSGKGGMAYILRADHGLDLPRSLQVEFSKIAQERMDSDGKELTSPELWALFRQAYLLDNPPMTLVKQQTVPTSPDNRELAATLRKADGSTLTIEGEGNGPIDAFVDALKEGVQDRVLVHRLSRARGRPRRQRDRGELCRDPGFRRPAVHGVGHGPQHRDGLAQGDARRGDEADAPRGQGALGRQSLRPACVEQAAARRASWRGYADNAGEASHISHGPAAKRPAGRRQLFGRRQ